MEATQQISVLDVPFQQVSLDYNTEKKMLIAKNGKDTHRPRSKKGSQPVSVKNLIRIILHVLTSF
jgi:hypothetical protein